MKANVKIKNVLMVFYRLLNEVSVFFLQSQEVFN